ncbi:MAG: InlB B-repeat-containing protein, partial [Candidatus Izimaplasma sp.]|nr:InlB B-repeat-containing protein [Candidatus Izimaplasma bacterium]
MKKRFLHILFYVFFLFGLVGCDSYFVSTTDLLTNITSSDISTTETTTESTIETTVINVTSNEETTQVLQRIYNLLISSESFNGTYQEWLETVDNPDINSEKEVIFRVKDNDLKWKYLEDDNWTELIDIRLFSGDDLATVTNAVVNEIGDLIITFSNDVSINLEDIIIVYTVEFKDYDGTLIDNQEVAYGLSAIVPDDPERDGYNFISWDLNTNEVTMDLVITAIYKPIEYTISFNSNGGNDLSDLTIGYELEFPKFDIPIKMGYDFVGWFKDEELTEEFIETKMPNEDITLYAKWELIQYQLNYMVVKEASNDVGLSQINYNEDLSMISVGSAHTLVLTSSGRVLAWGYNKYGQLGNGTYTDSHIPVDITDQFDLENSEQITLVSTGSLTSFAVTSNGRVFSWGYSGYFFLGDGTTSNRNNPVDISAYFNLDEDEKIISIVCGLNHATALTSYGKVFAWGYNSDGQIGDNTLVNKSVPINISDGFDLLPEETITQISAGALHMIALTSTNRVFVWGLNSEGQLGDGTQIDKHKPLEITSYLNLETSEFITFVNANGYHSFAMTSSHRLISWGTNSNGISGDNSGDIQLTPTDITSYFDLENGEIIESMYCYFHSAFVMTSNQRIFAWGYNWRGRLGDGTTSSKGIPVDISSHFVLEEEILYIAPGPTGYAVTSQANIFAWGSNYYGNFANNTTTDSYVPIDITFFDRYLLFETEYHGYNENIFATENLPIGYQVSHWYLDMEMTTEYTFTTMPANDLILYGELTLEEFNILFETNSEYIIEPLILYYEEQIALPANPTKIGHTFIGWFEDIELTIPFTKTHMPDEDISLYAKWQINQYTISFDTNGGTLIDPISKEYDTVVQAPVEPTMMDHEFKGWYIDEAFTTPYEFITIPAIDIILYAKFVSTIPLGLVYEIENDHVIITDYVVSEFGIVIPNTINGLPVTVIGAYAFQSTGLWQIVLNENLKEIRTYAFQNASNLTSIIIPESVTFIGANAFEQCYKLTEVIFEGESQLKSIENQTFGHCSALTSIIIPDSVISIGMNAFYGALNLKTVSLGNSVEIIKQGAFYNNQSLRYINLPEGLTRIEAYAFVQTYNLSSIVIPQSITYIGESAFGGCNSLIIYTKLSSTGFWSYNWNPNNRPVMWNIILHDSKDGLDYIIRADNYITILGQTPEYLETDMTIPSMIGLYQVDTIAYKAFESNKQLEIIAIPISVQVIGENAFDNAVAKIYTPYNEEPPSWQTHNWNPDEITVYWGDAKYYQTIITFETNGGSSIDSITLIEGDLFESPENPIREGYSFEGWYKDSALTENYFFSLVPIDNLTLFAKWIRNQSTIYFETNGGSDVSSITQDEGTIFIKPDNPIWENFLFDGWYTEPECINLYYFTTIPVDDIILYAKWSGTMNVEVNGLIFTVTPYGATLVEYNGSMLDVVIPNYILDIIPVVAIGDNVFKSCSSLTSVDIPEGVTEIGEYAFSFAYSLKSITLPSTLTTIGNNAFEYT